MLSAKEKEAWLRRAVDAPDLALGDELLRAFRVTSKDQHVAIHGGACCNEWRSAAAPSSSGRSALRRGPLAH
jgi:hypothetical protein